MHTDEAFKTSSPILPSPFSLGWLPQDRVASNEHPKMNKVNLVQCFVKEDIIKILNLQQPNDQMVSNKQKCILQSINKYKWEKISIGEKI